MIRGNNFFSEYTLENLLRSYIFSPNDKSIREELGKVIDSVIEFQNGKFLYNGYVEPSEAYNFMMSVLSLMNPETTLNDLKIQILKNETTEELSQFINSLIRILSNQEDNLGSVHVDKLIAWC